jgi:hypothetical protein
VKATEIVALKDELKGLYGSLDSSYDEMEKAYGGGLLADRQRYGAFPTDASDSQPDHIKTERDVPEVVIPICRPIVHATRSFIGQLPNLRVPPIDSTPEMLKLTEDLEQTGLGLWRFWNMRQRMLDIGFYDGLLGTAVGVIWPDIEKELPVLHIYSPRGFYPVMKGDNPLDLAYCMFVATYSGRQVAKMFNKPKLAAEKDVEVIQFIDDKNIVSLANGIQVDNITHGLGFCPVVSIPNDGIPGSPFGESTIAQIVKMQKERNYLYSLALSMAEEQFSQPIVLPDGSNWPEGIPMGPRDVIETPAGSQPAYRLPAPTIPFDIFRLADDLNKQIAAVSDIPQSMTQGDASPYQSGNSFTAQLGPTQAKLGVRVFANVFPAIEKLMWMSFKMMEIMWPNSDHTLYGTKDKATFTKHFKVEDFGGWYEFEVEIDPTQYFDEQTRWVMTLQAVQNQMLSKETGMQYLPMVKNIPVEKERIQREVQENIQQTLAAQQSAQSIATQNAPMNEPGKTGYGLEQGFVGEVPPAPVPGGIEVGSTPSEAPGGPAMAESGPQTDQSGASIDPLVSQAADLLRSVQKIKGQVYIVGNYLDPSYREQNSGEGASPKIEIALTDPLDKRTILNHIEKTVPEMYGQVKFLTIQGIPTEAYIDCSPGTTGYDVKGAEPTPEEGLAPTGAEPSPEEMQALMGAMGGGA